MPKQLLTSIIVVLVIAGLIVYGYWFSQRLKSDQKSEKYKGRNDIRKLLKPVSVKSFINPKFKFFHEALKKALPSSYIILPSISLELLFPEEQRQSIWLWGHYADFVVFTSKFIPVLVIDLVDISSTGDYVYTISNEVKKFLKNSRLNVLDYEISETYNINALREAIAKAINPLLK